MERTKVKISSSPLLFEVIRDTKINGIGFGNNTIEILVHPKMIIFKLDELDENGAPCIYVDDTLEAKFEQEKK